MSMHTAEMLNVSRNNISNDSSSSGSPYPAQSLTSIPNILVIIIGFLAIILNGILLVAIVRNAALVLKNHGAYLVANVAIADLLTGVFSLIYTFFAPQIAESIIIRDVLYALFWTSVESSLVTVFVMSLVRYISIVYPFKATTWISKRSILRCCIVVWLFSLFCGILHSRYVDIMRFCLGILFEITIIATAFLYYKIYARLGQRSRMSLSSKGMNKDLKREYQLTSVVVALTVIMVVTVLPYMIAGQIFISYKLLGHYMSGARAFVVYYLPVELTNFVLNPIIYAWRLPKYRYALLRTLKCQTYSSASDTEITLV